MQEKSIIQLLQDGLDALSIALSFHQQQLILEHLQELSRWNQTHNLTGIQDISYMITYHVLDSLAVMPYVKGARFIDVGTGAGFPGLPLAIARPDKQFVLLDSNLKKVQFLIHIVHTLKLNNVSVVHSRAERYTPPVLFDGILIRATSLRSMLDHVKHLLVDEGCLLAMISKIPENLQLNGYHIIQHETLHIPKLKSRALLILRKNTVK